MTPPIVAQQRPITVTESVCFSTGLGELAVERIHEQVMEFLRANPSQAFTEREIADAVLGTNWEAALERERLRQELSEAEFERRREAGDLPGENRQPLEDSIETVYVGLGLSRLLDLDLIEWRAVDAAALELPYDWDTVEVYTLN